MLSKLYSALLLPVLLFSGAQATMVDKRSVGALTPLSSKSTICNVLDYGGVADNSTDIGPAISKAFTECAIKGGATLYIPPGSYSLQTGVTLNKGSAFAIQIDGLITLTSDGSFGGNAIVIENASDVEVFSSNGKGAINGQGYITRITDNTSQNARLMRFISCSDLSVHDLIFVDSPTFHLVFNLVSNLEAYHITVRGPDLGGTDGIDLICSDNCYLHDIEVTNRDECISVKTPSQNVLIEDIYCNHSGGMSIGSLTADDVTTDTAAAVSNITMRNIYIFECTEALMIKTFPGGTGATGYVKDSLFENFWSYDTTYCLDIDQYWESHTTPDTGAVALSGLTFNNWTGTVDNGVSRGPIIIRGSDIVPITDIVLTNFDMWTVNEDQIMNQCKNVYGTGYCAGTTPTDGTLTTFTTTQTTATKPTGFVSPVSPAWGIQGYGTVDPIPVYTPAVFWEPASPAGAVATTSAVVSTAVKDLVTSSAVAAVATSSAVASVTKSSVPAVVSETATLSSTSAAAVTSAAGSVKVSSKCGGAPSSSAALPATKVAIASVSSVVKSFITTTSVASSASAIVPASSIAAVSSIASKKCGSAPSSSGVIPATSIAAASSVTVAPTASSSSAIVPTTSTTSETGSVALYEQCGGAMWTGATTCAAGTCVVQNDFYSQCVESS